MFNRSWLGGQLKPQPHLTCGHFDLHSCDKPSRLTKTKQPIARGPRALQFRHIRRGQGVFVAIKSFVSIHPVVAQLHLQ